jgi:hypoxanthine phosphoribosyltransferase
VTRVAASSPAAVLDWAAVTTITGTLAKAVAVGSRPDVVVGVLRGGMIPAVMLAHALGLREVRALDVTHTIADGGERG